MPDNAFLSLYKTLYLEFYENNPGTKKPTEFHLTREDAVKLLDLAKLLPPAYVQKFIQYGERETFPSLFGLKVVYDSPRNELK